MHEQQYPLRFGVVLACEETQSLAQLASQRQGVEAAGGKESVIGEEDPLMPLSAYSSVAAATSVDVCRLFGHAKVGDTH